MIKDTNRKCPKCSGIIRYYTDDVSISRIEFYFCEHHDYYEGYPLGWKLLVDPIDYVYFKMYDLFYWFKEFYTRQLFTEVKDKE